MADGTRKVWSSDGGRIREEERATSGSTGDGTARVRRETKGRRGKTVTAIHGLDLDAGQLADLASELKRRCGVGGSAKDGVITIQGDQVDKVMAALEERGHKVKRSGG